jgi:hypothetical protein
MPTILFVKNFFLVGAVWAAKPREFAASLRVRRKFPANWNLSGELE